MTERQPLTERQTEIFVLRAEGLPVKAIGKTLSIKPDTVKNTLSVSFEKLHAQNPTEALHAGIQNGIINPLELSKKIAQKRGIPDNWPEMLSDKEWEVAQVSTDSLFGVDNKSIGRELGIAAQTAHVHQTSIYKKLQITSRIELIILTLGWMQKQPPVFEKTDKPIDNS